jgi:hypothetical protein
MKIIITIEPAEDECGREMVQSHFEQKGDDSDSLAVLRAAARMELAFSQVYAKIHAESEIVKMLLDESEM